MKSLLIATLVLFSFAALAEAIRNPDQAAECRQLMHTKRRIYVEEMERCQGVLLRDSLEKFNNFSTRPEPSPDCEEAKDSQGLVNACREVGAKKVIDQGKAWGLTIRPQDVYVCDVDDNWVFDYVWYCANTPKGKISRMVQKAGFGACQ